FRTPAGHGSLHRAWRRSGQPLLDLLHCVGGDQHAVGTDQCDRVQALHVTHLDVRQVARGQVQVLGRVLGDDQRPLAQLELLQPGHEARGLRRVDVERLDDRDPALAVELGQDHGHGGAILLAVDLLREAAGLGCEGHAAADEDRGRQRAVTRTAALLLLRLLGGAADLGARLLRLGARAAGVAIGNDDLVDQVLAEFAPEHRFGYGQLAVAAANGKFHVVSPYALLEGRTMTSPPGAPGTAPLTAIRPRSASTFTTCRRCVPCVSEPMWPDIFLPGNTRPGVWRWPIEPGERCDSELPWVASPMLKFQRLIVPWKPLPLVTPWTSTSWPTSKMSALISPPTWKSAILSSATRSSHRPRPASTLALARCPASGLVSSEARLTPAVTCTAL